MRARQAAHRVRLREPVVADHEVVFRWDVTPSTELYRAERFRMTFPPELDLGVVPQSLWLRLGLICLHPHWALLRPCRVELPFYIGPAEREFWLRMIDVAAFQIEAYGGEEWPGRAAELVDEGPALPPVPVRVTGDRAAAAFSGGKDSLTQAGLLAELTERPLLVTTTSPVEWANDHVGAARARTLGSIEDRLPVDLVEVHSDFRSCWQNDFPSSQGCVNTVNELTDVLLYQASTIAAAAASGIARSYLASEADVQYNASLGGEVLQHDHFASSATTHAALTGLLGPGYRMQIGSLTYPLHMPQVQTLLWRRYRHLADLQFSCWLAEEGNQACSACGQCLEVALVILGEGFSPRTAGIDPFRLLCAWREPRPPPVRDQRRPVLNPNRLPRHKTARILQATPLERVAAILASDPAATDDDLLEQALDGFRALRARSQSLDVPPEPGYIGGFLDLVDEDLRDRLRMIYDEYFVAADPDEFAGMVSRSRSLARWIADPVVRQQPPPASWVRPALR